MTDKSGTTATGLNYDIDANHGHVPVLRDRVTEVFDTLVSTGPTGR